MYLYYYIVVKGRLCLCLFIHVPYHTKMNKSLVPECPTIIDVRSFTVSYKTIRSIFSQRSQRCRLYQALIQP